MANIKEIAEKTGLTYSNARLYVKALEKRKLILPKRSGKSLNYPEETVELVNRLKDTIKDQKLDINSAIDILVSTSMNDPISRLIKEIEDLKKENFQLRQLIEVYIAKTEELMRQLPPPKEEKTPWWKRLLKIR
jgi:DNA-binding transcriptional MerR regulator